MLDSDNPTPDARKIRNQRDASYYGAGIPSPYWGPCASVDFQSFSLHSEAGVASPEVQIGFLEKVRKPEAFSNPQLIYVCAEENESVAVAVAFEIVKSAVNAHLRVQVDHAGDIYGRPKVLEPVAMLYSVHTDMTTARRQAVRDWIRYYESCYRVIAATGNPDTLAQSLKIRPTTAFLVEPNTRRHL